MNPLRVSGWERASAHAAAQRPCPLGRGRRAWRPTVHRRRPNWPAVPGLGPRTGAHARLRARLRAHLEDRARHRASARTPVGGCAVPCALRRAGVGGIRAAGQAGAACALPAPRWLPWAGACLASPHDDTRGTRQSQAGECKAETGHWTASAGRNPGCVAKNPRPTLPASASRLPAPPPAHPSTAHPRRLPAQTRPHAYPPRSVVARACPKE
jgi:hypothetical protein